VTGAAVYAARRVKIAVEMRRLSGERHDFAFNGQDARQKTESDSADREIPVEAVKIRDLTLSERDRYMADWLVVQSRFVDHPRGAVIEADELVSAILQVRGYPMAGFELHEADLSGNHLHLMECYGSANARAAVAGRDGAATEQLRTALIQFRAIFDELVKVVAPGIDELVQVEAAIAQEPAA